MGSMYDVLDFQRPSHLISKQCRHCGQLSVMRVDEEDYWLWHEGALIQDAFPYLLPAEREMIKTGYHPTCWDELFNYEEDEDD